MVTTTDRGPLVVGVDKGTSVTKTAVFDEHGNQLAVASRRIPSMHPGPGMHEEDPERTWELTADTIRACMEQLGDRASDVVGIGVTGHMGGAWFVDEEGRSVRHSIAWPDARASSIVDALEVGPDHEEYLRICASGALPGMTIMLLARLAQTEPDLAARTHVVLNAKDFLQLRLAGVAVTEPSDVAFTPGDIDTQRSSDRLLEIVGASAWSGKFAPVLRSGEILGEVTELAAAQTGLPVGTPVVAGLGDAPAGMVGSGALDPGTSVSILGTSWLSANIVTDPHAGSDGIGWMYPMPGRHFAHFVANTSGASTLDWWVERLAPEVGVGDTREFGILEQEVLATDEAATAVTFLPYLSAAGVRSPFRDSTVRGTLLGLEDATSRGEIFRAVYEGMAYAMADCYDAFGTPPTLIRLTGGGAHSAIWPTVLSNTMNVPVELLATDEAAALGVAVLAGVAVGVWPSLADAVHHTTRIVQRIEPDPELYARHRRQFARFVAAQKIARTYYATVRSHEPTGAEA